MNGQAIRKLKRIGKRLLKWVAILLCAVAPLIAILAGIQQFATPRERSENPAPGAMVSVGGKKMHVYAEGEGDTTYVIVSGGGVGAPVLEYRPLWSRFAEQGRAVMVEYLGYGWSEDTDAPRTSKAIVEEIRAALAGADVKPPYVLVAHSLGGVYAMEYARRYPQELSAIVALDTTLPGGILKAKADGQALPNLDAVACLRKAGILRALLWTNPLLISGAPKDVYSAEEARKIATVTGWNYASRAMVREFQTIEQNLTDLLDTAFPKTLPVLMIQADPPGERAENYDWFLLERKRLTQDLDHGKVIELSAGHSGIYWTLSEDIARETLAFLQASGVVAK